VLSLHPQLVFPAECNIAECRYTYRHYAECRCAIRCNSHRPVSHRRHGRNNFQKRPNLLRREDHNTIYRTLIELGTAGLGYWGDGPDN
jgi:hypothetical protein